MTGGQHAVAIVLGIMLFATAANAQPAVPIPHDAQTTHPFSSARIDRVVPLGLAEPTGDYNVSSTAWNGLRTFAQLAQGDGLDVYATASVNWDTLSIGDVLVILHPTATLDASHIHQFIRSGGHIVLGDDFGLGAQVISHLGITRGAAADANQAAYYNDLPFAPIAVPMDSSHPLATNVDEIVTNHPATLIEVGNHTEVFGFRQGEAIVVHGQFGAGQFVILSDPSILINGMLQFPGNFQFALNLLRKLASAPFRGRVVVLTGAFVLHGEPTQSLMNSNVDSTVTRSLHNVNRWLRELNSWMLDPSAMRVIAVLAVVLFAITAAFILPFRTQSNLDGSWLRAAPRTKTNHDFASILEHLDSQRTRTSYVVPAVLLRNAVDRQLSLILERDAPLSTLSPAQLTAALRDQANRDVRRAAAAVLSQLRKLPSQADISNADSNQFVSRAEFERLHQRVTQLETVLDSRASQMLAEQKQGTVERGIAS